MSITQLDEKVLAVLKEAGDALGPEQLLQASRSRVGEATEASVLAAMWRLIDQKQAKLTVGRRVRAA